jgi:hypothetical protein
MEAMDFLARLDKHAREYNFPAFDNAHTKFADARLSVFIDSKDWLIAFELVNWSEKELVFGEDIYFFGTCVYPEGLRRPGRIVMSWPDDMPILDPDSNECIANWEEWAVLINGDRHIFRPVPEEYARAGIIVNKPPNPGSISEADILRYVIFKLGHIFFADDRELLAMAPECSCINQLFLRTEAWQHPDVLAGERPSTNPALRSLVNAVNENNAALFNPGTPNTDWLLWSQTDDA